MSLSPRLKELKETDGKDKLVAALKSSFDFCNTAMPKVTDATLGDTIELWVAEHRGLSL
jgi:hypothetical protein